MCNIMMNGKPLSINNGDSLKVVLIKLNYADGFYAVAVNNTFIPKSRYADLILHENDEIEVLTPMVGG